MESDGFTIKCSNHTYITLEWNKKFIFCLDNDMMRTEEIIYKIEKRTGMDFHNITITGCKDDFSGLRFFNGGWKRKFWEDFPSKNEVDSYMKLNEIEARMG